MILTLYVDGHFLLGTNKLLPNKLKKQLMDWVEMMSMGGVSRVLGMNIARDHEKGMVTINQRGYTGGVIECFV